MTRRPTCGAGTILAPRFLQNPSLISMSVGGLPLSALRTARPGLSPTPANTRLFALLPAPGPFSGAVRVPRGPPSALSVPATATVSRTAQSRRAKRGNQLGQSLPTASLPSRAPENSYALSGTFREENDARAPIRPTSALSVVHPPTLPVREPASEACALLGRIITPYVAGAWQSALDTTGLSSKYPSLIYKITHGFPLGYDMPPIHETFTPPNHSSAREHHAVVWEYLCSERDKF